MTNEPNQEQATFTDRQGTQWDVTLTMAGAMRVDNSDFTALGVEEGFSILEPRRDIFNKILGDSRLAMAVVWAIVQPQVKEKLNVDPKEEDVAQAAFYERLDGGVIKSAKDALWGTITNFFPEQKTVLLSLKTAYDAAQVKIGKELEMMQGDIAKMMEDQVTLEMGNVRKELEQLKTGNVVGQTSSK